MDEAGYVVAEAAGAASARDVAPDGRMVGYSGPRTGMRTSSR